MLSGLSWPGGSTERHWQDGRTQLTPCTQESLPTGTSTGSGVVAAVLAFPFPSVVVAGPAVLVTTGVVEGTRLLSLVVRCLEFIENSFTEIAKVLEKIFIARGIDQLFVT